MSIMNTCARCGGTLTVGDLTVDVRKVTSVWEDGTVTHDRGDALAHLECPTTPRTATEAAWRKAIADQVRRNCTPSSEAYARGGDIMIRAVADWIENPPDWSTFETPVGER